MFPIGDEQIKGGHFPYVTYILLALNIVVYLFQMSMSPGQLQHFIFDYASIPQEIMAGQKWYTLVTSMFMHGSIMHLIGNMMFLWVFADNIEAIVGSFKFLIFYLLGGLFASMAHILLNMHSGVPCLGASGAIAAVLGAYIIMFPQSKIKTFAFVFFINIPAFLFLGIWIFQQFISGFASLNASTTTGAGVAWWAHIGGFVFGVLAGLLFRPRAQAHFRKTDMPILRRVRDDDRLYY